VSSAAKPLCVASQGVLFIAARVKHDYVILLMKESIP
jgi:hypothetical protein